MATHEPPVAPAHPYDPPAAGRPPTAIETRGGRPPAWAVFTTVLLFLVGGVYLAGNLAGDNPAFAIPGASGSPPVASGPPDPALGEALVAQATPQCASCHGADFTGLATFPSLVGVEDGPKSENLQELAAQYPDQWIGWWIDGTVPEVQGIDRLGMPAFGEQFSPEQIDAIVAYLRTLGG